MPFLLRLSYASRSLIPAGSRELHAIDAVSMRRNRQLGLTGALFHDGAAFFQVLEGPPDNIRAVFESIRRDPRHAGIDGLIEHPVRERRFPRFKLRALPGADPAVSALRPDAVAALPLDIRESLAERLLAA